MSEADKYEVLEKIGECAYTILLREYFHNPTTATDYHAQ
jgi:hypothetical protein